MIAYWLLVCTAAETATRCVRGRTYDCYGWWCVYVTQQEGTIIATMSTLSLGCSRTCVCACSPYGIHQTTRKQLILLIVPLSRSAIVAIVCPLLRNAIFEWSIPNTRPAGAPPINALDLVARPIDALDLAARPIDALDLAA